MRLTPRFILGLAAALTVAAAVMAGVQQAGARLLGVDPAHWGLVAASGAGALAIALLLVPALLRRHCVLESELESQHRALVRSQQQLRMITDALPVFIAYVDADLRYRFNNRYYEERFGISTGTLRGMPVEDFLGAEHFARIRPLLLQGMEGKRVSYMDTMPMPEIGPRDLMVHLVPDLLDSGKVRGVFLLAQDTTDLHHAEEQLEQFFELSQDLFGVAGTDGHFKRVNPAFERLLGYTREELLSRPYLELVHPEDRERTAAAADRTHVGKSVRDFENRYLCKDGSIRWMQWRSTGAGESGLIYAVARDITDRKRADQALREREARLASLFRAAPVGLGFLVGGVFQRLNHRLCEMTGYPEAELVGRPARAIFPGEDSNEAIGAQKYRQITEAGSGTVETWLRRRDGSLFPALVSSTPVGEASPAQGVAFTVQDITYRKQAELQTERLLGENRALAKRNMEIQERERKFIAQELHDELGQGLTAIRADAEAIIAQAGDESPAVVDSALAIARVADRVYETTHAIMRRLRPPLLDEAGLATSLGMIVGEWQRAHPETRCEVAIIGRIDDLRDPANVTVFRLVQEALTNVAKHAGADRVNIGLERQGPTDGKPDRVVVRIEDDGGGFDPTETVDGLGVLGMRERVLAANGSFNLRTAPGRGVSITAELPVPPAQAPAVRSAAPQ